mgnify:CR=1 FL=1
MAEVTPEQVQQLLSAAVGEHRKALSRMWLWVALLMFGLMVFWGYTFKKEVVISQALLRQARVLNQATLALEQRKAESDARTFEVLQASGQAIDLITQELSRMNVGVSRIEEKQRVMRQLFQLVAPEAAWHLEILERVERLEQVPP